MTDVSIVSCGSYELPEVQRALEQAIAPFGGLEWVTPGMKIAVKVNLVGAHKPEEAATTHPAVVKALCDALAARKAQVVVGDSPGGLFTQGYLSGIHKAAGMPGVVGENVRLNDCFEEQEVAFPAGVSAKTIRFTKYLLDADAVIDCCKPKTHGMMAYTGACKNFFGAIPGLVKGEYHYRYADYTAFANMLVDLAECIKPRLCLADFVWSMEGNGPTKGTPRFVGALMASESPHKMDVVGAHIMHIPFENVPTLVEAHKRGLVPDSVAALDVAGDYERFVIPDFKQANKQPISGWSGSNPLIGKLALALLASKPMVNKAGCIGCGKCAEVCPAKAIEMLPGGKNKLPKIDRAKCIRCFCCQEFCPKGAMVVHRPLAAKLINK
ncbi:MAG: DUF362 domain-containing protein [Clostridia bacterium]|nr:DUF362 domain-containing protein [Clostridia bacterium]